MSTPASDAARLSPEEIEDLYNHAPCGYHSVDRNGMVVRINDTELDWLGYRRDEVEGKVHITTLLAPQSRQSFKTHFPTLVEQGRVRDVELEFLRRDGTTFPALLSATAIRDDSGAFVMSRATVYDMSERLKAERQLTRMNRALTLLSKCNMALIHASSEAGLLNAVCQLAIDPGGYRMAWVGYAEEGEDKPVRPVAQTGFEKGYLEQANITWADTERGQGPTGIALREGTPEVNQNFLTNPKMAPWRENALRQGFQSSIALPLMLGPQRGALMMYAAEPDAFTDEEVMLLRELAADLAFGIVTLRARKDADRIQAALQKSLEDMVRAVAATLEMRDPYTAGHQRRVAELSMAIAREMGLPQARIHALGLAASIHDVGKIKVPAEILSKPGLLSTLEFEVIKQHAQVGYDILRGIEFPLPIADWIWQHHERLDGSGYPLGLKADAILPESRILAVADVVEAIYSSRPYRPGRGIEAALQEISSKRGVLYDPNAADACVRLFREKNYTMPAGSRAHSSAAARLRRASSSVSSRTRSARSRLAKFDSVDRR